MIRSYNDTKQREEIITRWKHTYGQRFYSMFYQIAPNVKGNAILKQERIEVVKAHYDNGVAVDKIAEVTGLTKYVIRKYLGVRRKESVPLMQLLLKCDWCSKDFRQVQNIQRFCSQKCSDSFANRSESPNSLKAQRSQK
jgi:hypothetical protein